MEAREFIAKIKMAVRDSAIEETMRVLQLPPGRRPSSDLLKQANWYRSLSPESQQMLSQVIANAVSRGVFGFLCVLDGVRLIEDDEHKGDFQLHYVKNGSKLLNGPDAPMLHELFNDPEV
jgi:hypothetical protein